MKKMESMIDEKLKKMKGKNYSRFSDDEGLRSDRKHRLKQSSNYGSINDDYELKVSYNKREKVKQLQRSGGNRSQNSHQCLEFPKTKRQSKKSVDQQP